MTMSIEDPILSDDLKKKICIVDKQLYAVYIWFRNSLLTSIEG